MYLSESSLDISCTMFNQNLCAALDVLHKLKPLPISETESRIERIFKTASNFAIGGVVVSFVAISLSALAATSFDLPSAYWSLAAKSLYLILILSSLLWIFAETFPTVLWIFTYKNQVHQRRKIEILHDLENADRLLQMEPLVLKMAENWLSLRIERMRLHVGFFTGGSDKVAVIALMLGAWGIWSNFPSSDTTELQYMYMGAGAFVGGLGIGGLMGSVIIKDLSYQRDLLLIALRNS